MSLWRWSAKKRRSGGAKKRSSGGAKKRRSAGKRKGAKRSGKRSGKRSPSKWLKHVKATLANSAVNARYGTGTADLLEYICIVSEASGCYG